MPGCTSYESAQNTHVAREYLTEDIEDQIVFNLIRAMNGLPFAHYDVSTVQSIVSAKVTPQVGGSRSEVSSGFQPGVVVTSALRAVTRTITPSISGERNNSVTVNVGPVFDEPKIYASYVSFLNLPEKIPGDSARSPAPPTPTPPLMEPVSEKRTETQERDKDDKPVGNKTVEVETNSEKPTPEKPAPKINFENIHSVVGDPAKPGEDAYVPHTLRHWGHLWYYIPSQYKAEFSDLCLSLVARGGGGATGAGGTKKKAAGDKSVQRLNEQLMQQNTLIQQGNRP